MFRTLIAVGVVGMLALLVAATPPAVAAGPVQAPCYNCGDGCAHPNYHDDDAQGSTFTTASAHVNYCYAAKCDMHPANCGETLLDVELDMIERAATGGQIGVLSLLMAPSDSRVTYEPDRNAIQVSGCRGGIIASFPLADGAGQLLEALTTQ